MDRPRKARWKKWLLAALVLLSLHLLLAPATSRLESHVVTSIREGLASRKSNRYLKALGDAGPKCREDLVPCVLAFRDFLATRNIKLRVILRPERESLLKADGSPQTGVNATALAGMGAARVLKKAGIVTVNLLPALHHEACLRGGGEVFQEGDPHYTQDLVQIMADTIAGSMTDHQKAQEGRHLLLVGDCYATLITARLKLGTVLPSTRALWKNAGDTMMAYELSRLPEQTFEEVGEIYWCLNFDVLTPGSTKPLPLPSPLPKDGRDATGERTLRAVLTKRTETPADMGRGSPYADALILHEFTGDNGEKILAITSIMKAHEVNLTVRNWFQKKPFILTLQPWEQAVRESPALGREQLLDDIQDFTAERYYIKDWSHAP